MSSTIVHHFLIMDTNLTVFRARGDTGCFITQHIYNFAPWGVEPTTFEIFPQLVLASKGSRISTACLCTVRDSDQLDSALSGTVIHLTQCRPAQCFFSALSGTALSLTLLL